MNTLLFIDDEEGVRRSMARALKREPYRTLTAENGEAGIALVKENLARVVIVVSDYKMPGLDGLETLMAIGGMNPEITRIILTGYATMEAAIAATNQGIDGFLTKPFDNRQLRANIRDITVRKRLRQFVAEQVYREIERAPGALNPRFHDVTVLFSDIRGFTRMAQDVSPEVLADYLNNHYFTPMGEIAYAHGGMVDKHIGDSIMVVFGAPLPQPDDALRAVRAALAMQEKAREIDARLQTSGGLRLQTGIGIATGGVFSGILGSLRKKEFTSIGMAVNIAARLQHLAGGGEIIVSDSTWACVEKLGKGDGMQARQLAPTTVKGVDTPLTVYRVTPD
ncbi:MAG: response regulator [Desulfobacterales bacterium]|nr:response regulator [Desulfobacterales bacterium]